MEGNNILGETNPVFVAPQSFDFRLQASSPAIDTGTLIPGIKEDGIKQVLSGLNPNTTYVSTAWVKVDDGEEIQIGVTDFGGSDISVTSNSTSWTMLSILFTTGENTTSATIYAHTPLGNAYAYVDDFGVVEE